MTWPDAPLRSFTVAPPLRETCQRPSCTPIFLSRRAKGNLSRTVALVATAFAIAIATSNSWAASQTSPAAATTAVADDFSFGTDGHLQQLTARIAHAHTDQYNTALEEFDQYLKANADDVATQVEKCQFIQHYAYAEDETIEAASIDAKKCDQALRTGPFANEPRVQMYFLRLLYGDERRATARRLLKVSSRWPPALLARLYETLADSYDARNAALAGQFAAAAVQLNPQSRKRLDAAEHWLQFGAPQRALRLLRTTPADAWEKMSVYRGVDLYLRLGAPNEAVALLRKHSTGTSEISTRFLLARALAAAGRTAVAREIYVRTFSESSAPDESLNLTEYFNFEITHGSAAQATAAYRRLRAQIGRAHV